MPDLRQLLTNAFRMIIIKAMKNQLLTLKETATRLRVSEKSILRYLWTKKLKGFKLGTGPTSLWRIPEEELENFIKRCQNKNL